MVNPTSNRLYQQSSSLFFHKIHQQLPLTPRKSKQLLDVITKSFRDNLDRAHSPLLKESLNNQDAKATESRSAGNNAPPIDRHLGSILRNPLFTTRLMDLNVRDDTQLPMDEFKRAVVSGRVTLDFATACLQKEQGRLLGLAVSDSTNARKSNAGRHVLDWLTSSGILAKGAFLDNQAFTTILAECLMIEERGADVLAWVQRSLKDATSCSEKDWPSLGQRARHALASLVIAQEKVHQSLDAAYEAFNGAAKFLHHCSPDSKRSKYICAEALSFLYNHSTRLASRYKASSPEIFDAFLSTLKQQQWPHAETLVAHISLHHPSKPTAGLAMQLLERMRLQKESTRVFYDTGTRKVYLPLFVVTNICMDTIRVLETEGRERDVEYVLMKQELLCPQRTQAIAEQQASEATSIELLGKLGLT